LQEKENFDEWPYEEDLEEWPGEEGFDKCPEDIGFNKWFDGMCFTEQSGFENSDEWSHFEIWLDGRYFEEWPDTKDFDERLAVDFGKPEFTNDWSGTTNDDGLSVICFEIWPGDKMADSHIDCPCALGTCAKDDSSWLLADIDLSLTLLPFLRFGSDLLRAF